MTREEAIERLKNVWIRDALQEDYDALDMAIKALEQEPCEDKEYEKDLNELKEQILKEGNTLVAKQDLLERFVEIDNEYKHRPWNLLQILANMDILIGEKPCDDCISRQAVLDIVNNPLNIRLDEIIKKLPPVTPERPKADVFDKIRAEIENHCGLRKENNCKYCSYCNCVMGVRELLEIFDKYKAESEVSE